MGDYKKQLECIERALPIFEKQYGQDHIEYAIVLVDLRRAHGNLGEYKKQLECIERALPIYEKQYGQDHIQYART